MSTAQLRTTWTRRMLLRLRELHMQGRDIHTITDILFDEFGGPVNFGETRRELEFLRIGECDQSPFPLRVHPFDLFLLLIKVLGPRESIWTPGMEARLKDLHARGWNVESITTQLLYENMKPDHWQETYRKMQVMKIRGEIA